MSTSTPINVPDALIASQLKHGGAHGRAWITSLPRLITNIPCRRWTTGGRGGDNRQRDTCRLRRFDLLTEVLGLDRQRAIGWTLGRVLQNALWDIEDGDTALDPTQIAIAAALMRRRPYSRLPT